MENFTPRVARRKLMASGNSVVLTVPQDWLKENGLKAGEEVLMVANGHLNFMKMTPENVTKVRNQLTQINHDPRSDDRLTGEKRQALVHRRNDKSLQ